ncbi:hypothetical protein NEUTE2DRAFT_76130 [Neurospora tetrasperma FGSC 2509]|nr:hypothetical protein NEUTE2DRAFT_76130 [Neurospora tetrasperma FGSC 2509]
MTRTLKFHISGLPMSEKAPPYGQVAGVNRRWNDEPDCRSERAGDGQPGVTVPAGRGRPGRLTISTFVVTAISGCTAVPTTNKFEMEKHVGSRLRYARVFTHMRWRVCVIKALANIAAPRTGCLTGSGGETSLDNKGRPAAYSASGAR